MDSRWLPALLVALAVAVGCTSASRTILRLAPLPEPAVIPSSCTVISVLPGSPAEKSGLQVGDVILQVNGKKPLNAAAVADLIRDSDSSARLEVARTTGSWEGARRWITASLQETWPRLGAVCDLTGWRASGVTPAGNESVTIFRGPASVTLSSVIDRGVVYVRLRVANNSRQPWSIAPVMVRAKDGRGQVLSLWSPDQVLRHLHGAAAEKVKVQPLPREGKKEALTRVKGQREQVQIEADYLGQESLWPVTLKPGEVADGLVFFSSPTVMPLEISFTWDHQEATARFDRPRRAPPMPVSKLAPFFEQQKKGTPLRLTLRSGKVFVGRFSSYDPINELVWFDMPSVGLFNTASFGLSKIAGVQVIEPQGVKSATGQLADTPLIKTEDSIDSSTPVLISEEQEWMNQLSR